MEQTNIESLPATLSACLQSRFRSLHLLASSGRVHNPDALRIGQQRFSEALPVVQGDCANHPVERFAGSDTQRLQCLNALETLTEARLLMGVRGGYGITRLLDQIDFKSMVTALCESGSMLCAHSDFTALQTALLAHSLKAGSKIPHMLQGPMLCVDFGNETLSAAMLSGFENALLGFPNPLEWQLAQAQHAQDISRAGILWGGNLSMLVSLLGTPHFPEVRQGLLFIEDVNEHPYRIERMLLQLLQAGVLQQQSALIVGACSDWKPSPLDHGYDLPSAINYVSHKAGIPVIQALPFGHIVEKTSLPVGKSAQITVKDHKVTLTITNALE